MTGIHLVKKKVVISDMDVAWINAAAKNMAAADVDEPQAPGQKMPDGTIYLGRYSPKDREGNSLSKTFNVFAAPEDLPKMMTYLDTVKYIAGLKNWNGYDGTNYANDKEIYAALKNKTYRGGWIIPTRDILDGKNVDFENTTPDNLCAHKDKGAFKGTFKTAVTSGSTCSLSYLSSTEHSEYSNGVCDIRLLDGSYDWNYKDSFALSCRLVRLVPV